MMALGFSNGTTMGICTLPDKMASSHNYSIGMPLVSAKVNASLEVFTGALAGPNSTIIKLRVHIPIPVSGGALNTDTGATPVPTGTTMGAEIVLIVFGHMESSEPVMVKP